MLARSTWLLLQLTIVDAALVGMRRRTVTPPLAGGTSVPRATTGLLAGRWPSPEDAIHGEADWMNLSLGAVPAGPCWMPGAAPAGWPLNWRAAATR